MILSRSFEPGDKVVCVFPGAADEGTVVQIVKATGPGIMNAYGVQFAFKQSYQVFVEGYGDTDPVTKRPIIYPSEFLVYAFADPEQFTNQPVITLESFDETLKDLGYSKFFDTIARKGETK
jgi:hypothetical protein